MCIRDRIINEANIGAVCIESRPHPGFLEETWWSDLDVIFDEAKKRNMKVWILDDSHFPSGFSNGALKGKYPELHRQFVTYKKLDTLDKGIFTIKEEYKITPPFEKSMIENFMMGDCEIFNDDECLGFVGKDEEGKCLVNPGKYTISVGGQQPDALSEKLTGKKVDLFTITKNCSIMEAEL